MTAFLGATLCPPLCVSRDKPDEESGEHRRCAPRGKRERAAVNGGRGHDLELVDGRVSELEPIDAEGLQPRYPHQCPRLRAIERHGGELVNIGTAHEPVVLTGWHGQGQHLVGAAPPDHPAVRGERQLQRLRFALAAAGRVDELEPRRRRGRPDPPHGGQLANGRRGQQPAVG